MNEAGGDGGRGSLPLLETGRDVGLEVGREFGLE
jgi:hypothetical protein